MKGWAEVIKQWQTRVKQWLSDEKRGRWLWAVGAIGVALVLLSGVQPKKAVTTATNPEAFIRETEERLTEIVSSIEGAGACRVLVTLENGVEYVYATEQKVNTDRQQDTDRFTQRNDSESSVIIVEGSDGREGLLVTEIQPTIRGVVVVCEGGDREEIRARVVEAVTVALNVTSKRVCVTKLT